MDKLVFVSVFDQQTSPGILRDAPHGVEYCPKDKVTDILRHCPDQTGNAPGQQVSDEGGQSSAKFIGDGAAEHGEDRLDQQPQAGNRPNLRIVDT